MLDRVTLKREGRLIEVRLLFRLPSVLHIEWAERLVSRWSRLVFLTTADPETFVALRV